MQFIKWQQMAGTKTKHPVNTASQLDTRVFSHAQHTSQFIRLSCTQVKIKITLKGEQFLDMQLDPLTKPTLGLPVLVACHPMSPCQTFGE